VDESHWELDQAVGTDFCPLLAVREYNIGRDRLSGIEIAKSYGVFVKSEYSADEKRDNIALI
jgi:hypothetical protein